MSKKEKDYRTGCHFFYNGMCLNDIKCFCRSQKTMENKKKNKMISKKFRIHGMSAPRMFTLRNKYGSWWAESGLTEDGYKSLFKWAKSDDDFWKQEIYGILEYERESSDGTPANAIVTEIIIK